MIFFDYSNIKYRILKHIKFLYIYLIMYVKQKYFYILYLYYKIGHLYV